MDQSDENVSKVLNGYQQQEYLPPPIAGAQTPTMPEPGRATKLKRRRLPLSRTGYRSIWLWEILASLFSIVCVAAIAGLLASVQGMPLDHWQRGSAGRTISPTAVVSIIGAISKSMCMLAVAEILAQLKWMHFARGRTRRLVDLELFDSASQGPWGALQLLVTKNRTALLAGCASVLTIVALAMDPFLQLTFSFPIRMTPVTSGTGAGAAAAATTATPPTILASQLYDPHNLGERYEQCYGDVGVDTTLQAAILLPVWNAIRAPDLPCSFDSCTWPTITTLGVCSSCIDLTATVTSTCVVVDDESIQCNYTIPSSATNTTGNGTTFVTIFGMSGGATERMAYQPLWNSTVDVYSNGGLAYFDTRGTPSVELVRTSFISFASDLPWIDYINTKNDTTLLLTNQPPIKRSMQCTFNLCARTFTNPSYANFSNGPYGGPQTPLNVSSVPPTTSGVGLLELTPLSSSSSNDRSANTSAQNMTFRINVCDYTDLAIYMAELFTTAYSSSGAAGLSSLSPFSPVTDLLTAELPISPNIGLLLSQFDDISTIMGSIADSMTESIRTAGNSTAYSGTGFNSVTYIEITWAWLALPIALVVLTFVLLLVVILRNRASGTPVWKSSSMALLFHNLEGWDQSELRIDGPADLTARLDQMTVRMVNDDGRHAFVREE